MLQYVNKYVCSLNRNEELIVIKLQQSEPFQVGNAKSDESTTVNDRVNDVASIIMTKDVALKLEDGIRQLCDEG